MPENSDFTTKENDMAAMTKQEFINYWMGRESDDEMSQYDCLVEHVMEASGEYGSECAMFGDAGPGMGYRLQQSKQQLARVTERLKSFGVNIR